MHVEGEWLRAAAGAFVLVPRGTVHTIANAARDPVGWMTLISPAERAEWVEAEHELLVAGDEPDPEALAAVHSRYGLEVVGPPPPLPSS